MKASHVFVILGSITLASPQLTQAQQQATTEEPKDILAAQIRSQGFVCDQAVDATPDATRSKPDHAVWILKCSNGTYRVSRAPDMAAKVELLQ